MKNGTNTNRVNENCEQREREREKKVFKLKRGNYMGSALLTERE